MKGGTSLLIIGIILAGAIIALAVGQGQKNTTNTVINVTTYQNITLPFGLTLPFANITGFSGVANISQDNLTGITIPAENVTEGTFSGEYTFDDTANFQTVNIDLLLGVYANMTQYGHVFTKTNSAYDKNWVVFNDDGEEFMSDNGNMLLNITADDVPIMQNRTIMDSLNVTKNLSVIKNVFIGCTNMSIYTNGTHLILNVTGGCA
jgi:hypothetical protein